MMVGFPGETDADFEELLDFVRDVRFDRLGAFAYSEEDDTYAARHYTDDVPEDVRLMAVQEEIASELASVQIGQTLDVLVERIEDGYAVGRTEYDSPEVDPEIYLKLDENAPCPATGQWVRAQVTGVDGYDLLGNIVPL